MNAWLIIVYPMKTQQAVPVLPSTTWWSPVRRRDQRGINWVWSKSVFTRTELGFYHLDGCLRIFPVLHKPVAQTHILSHTHPQRQTNIKKTNQQTSKKQNWTRLVWSKTIQVSACVNSFYKWMQNCPFVSGAFHECLSLFLFLSLSLSLPHTHNRAYTHTHTHSKFCVSSLEVVRVFLNSTKKATTDGNFSSFLSPKFLFYLLLIFLSQLLNLRRKRS